MARPGKDLKLTIDLDLQMAAEKAMEGKNGAIVAMDPHTGEILAHGLAADLRSQPVRDKLIEELLERDPRPIPITLC